MSSLSEMIVVITGAATGLGRALAIEAAARGAHVLLVDVDDASESLELIRAAGGRADAYRVDISSYEDVASMAESIVRTYGSVNVLVNNAAAGGGAGTLEAANPIAVKKMFEVNVLGVFNGIHAFGPALRATAAQGHPAYILNLGSEHSLGVPPHVPPVSAYTVSKHAPLGLTHTAQRDFEASGVRVSMLAPGWIRTPSIQARIVASAEWAALVEQHAQTPEYVASCAWDGLLKGLAIIPTNPFSREFVLKHARDMMEVAQQLPKLDSPNDLQHKNRAGTSGTSGDGSKCPVAMLFRSQA
jgi:NAD(P)-dependent dehydrogenase (short-subunit alcohol dehydrogenase family)